MLRLHLRQQILERITLTCRRHDDAFALQLQFDLITYLQVRT